MKTKILISTLLCCVFCSSALNAQKCRPVKFERLGLGNANYDLSHFSTVSVLVELPSDSDSDSDSDFNSVTTGEITVSDAGLNGSATSTAGTDSVSTTPPVAGGLLLAELFAQQIGSAVSVCSNPFPPIMGQQHVLFTSGFAGSFGGGRLAYLVKDLGVPDDKDDCTYTAEFNIDVECVLDLVNGADYRHKLRLEVRLFNDLDTWMMAGNSENVITFDAEWDPDKETFLLDRGFHCSTELKDPVVGFEQDDLSDHVVPGPTYDFDTEIPNQGLKKLEFLVKAGQVIDVLLYLDTSVDATSACPNLVTLSTSGTYFFDGKCSLEINDKVLLGDANCDGVVDLIDIAAFVAMMSGDGYKVEADINRDCDVNVLDVAPFVDLLTAFCD